MSGLRERFGNPQIIAACLLLIFLAQCAWFIAKVPLNHSELAWLQTAAAAPHAQLAPTVRGGPLMQVVPRALVPKRALLREDQIDPTVLNFWRWLLRAPFVICGVLLGAAHWYVARRLYGNAGGYIALTIYVFTPEVIARSSLIDPAAPAAWGTFGLIFTGIAVAHTLYAPREVVLWNWKRILLLGVSIALAIGSEPVLALALLIALGLTLWLAPHRKGAVVLILGAATSVAAVLLSAIWLASYLAHGAAPHISFADLRVSSLTHAAGWKVLAASLIGNGPAPLVMLAIALITWLLWKHTRFFGTAAPMIVALLLTLLGLLFPATALTLFFVALPFWMVFISGVFADLLESRQRSLVLGITIGVLLAHAAFNVISLARL